MRIQSKSDTYASSDINLSATLCALKFPLLSLNRDNPQRIEFVFPNTPSLKKAVDDLRNRKTHLDDLIIYTQIKRKLSSYEQQAPHVKAGKKLVKAGYKVKVGTLVEFIVTTGSGSISDRAVPVQLLGNKQYDPEYYIENQVLPAVMKILRELGVKEDDLKYKGKQTKLGGF